MTEVPSGAGSAAPKILAGGITVSMAIGLVGLVAARAAAEANDDSAAAQLAQEKAVAEQQAGLAVLVAYQAEQEQLKAQQLEAIKAEYQAQLDQLAAEYQAQLDAYTPPALVVTTYVGSSSTGGGWSAPADTGGGWSAPADTGGGWSAPASSGSGWQAPTYTAPAPTNNSTPTYSAPAPAAAAPAPAPAAAAPAPAAPAPAPAPVTSGS